MIDATWWEKGPPIDSYELLEWLNEEREKIAPRVQRGFLVEDVPTMLLPVVRARRETLDMVHHHVMLLHLASAREQAKRVKENSGMSEEDFLARLRGNMRKVLG